MATKWISSATVPLPAVVPVKQPQSIIHYVTNIIHMLHDVSEDAGNYCHKVKIKQMLARICHFDLVCMRHQSTFVLSHNPLQYNKTIKFNKFSQKLTMSVCIYHKVYN